MARYQPRDADFVLAGDDTLDEELPRPVDLDPPWVRRGARPAAYLLTVSVVAGCLLRATGDEQRPAPPAGSPVAAQDDGPAAPDNDLAAQGIAVNRPATARGGSALISDDLSDACPPGRSCLTSSTAPAPVLAALRAAFPGAADITVRTVSLPQGADRARMLARMVHATAGLVSITVEVLPEQLPARSGLVGSGNGAIAFVQRPSGGVTVRTTAVGTGVSARPDAPSARLAADPRLLTVDR